MGDFTFGTLATDELKLVHHRATQCGLQHGHDLAPTDSTSGPTGDDHGPVLGPDVTADHVTCYYTLDGTEPAGSRGLATTGCALPLERTGVAWDTLVWGYAETWRGLLPAQPDGVTRALPHRRVG